jgi:NAD(P)-dependent dehydrogenase (short-subunit alcohol dehydrogenase family)
LGEGIMGAAYSAFRLDGRVAAVIGAGSGIGEAVARACAAQGARVACLDVDPAKADAVARDIGAPAEAAAVDIRDGKGVDACFEALRSRLGRLDACVCTPSINVRKPLLQYCEQEFEQVVAINLRGNFNVLRAAGRIMAAAGRGSIVLVSSIRSLVVEPGQGVYAMTKAGIVQLVRTAASELGASGVRVNALAPGVVDTPLTAPIKKDPAWYGAYADKSILKRWATPDEMAWPTVFLLSDAASYMTGSVLFVDGGWTAQDGRFQPPGM